MCYRADADLWYIQPFIKPLALRILRGSPIYVHQLVVLRKHHMAMEMASSTQYEEEGEDAEATTRWRINKKIEEV